jgi:hypothetical protein
MTIRTLKEVKEIGGFEVVRHDFIQSRGFICISDQTNEISFHLQSGPIKEVGLDGCQVDTMIETSKIILEALNKEFPCRETSMAITKLDETLMWLEKRKKDRIKRGVEGKSEA